MTDDAVRPQPLDLDAIRHRAEMATEGPWAYASTGDKDNDWAVGRMSWPDESDVLPDDGPVDEQETTRWVDAGQPDDSDHEAIVIDFVCEGYANPSDASFIAHARQDVPALIAEVERLRREKVGE